jgi:hypothetical protein
VSLPAAAGETLPESSNMTGHWLRFLLQKRILWMLLLIAALVITNLAAGYVGQLSGAEDRPADLQARRDGGRVLLLIAGLTAMWLFSEVTHYRKGLRVAELSRAVPLEHDPTQGKPLLVPALPRPGVPTRLLPEDEGRSPMAQQRYLPMPEFIPNYRTEPLASGYPGPIRIIVPWQPAINTAVKKSKLKTRLTVTVLVIGLAVAFAVSKGWHHKLLSLPVPERPVLEKSVPDNSVNWSGVWMQRDASAAVFRLWQSQEGSLTGEFVPDGGLKNIYPFTGEVDGGTVTFSVKAKGTLWCFRLTRVSGAVAKAVRWKDLSGMTGGPLAPVWITPRTDEERARDDAIEAKALAKRREEMRQALTPSDFGQFDRIGDVNSTNGGDFKNLRELMKGGGR